MRFAVTLLVSLMCGGLSGGCLSEGTRDVVGYVATAQSGSISKLKDRRGTGPFRTYRVPPDQMFDIVVVAVGKARDRSGAPIEAIFPSVLRGEVVIKERAVGKNNDNGYRDPFLSAAYIVVHALPKDPTSCKVEWHSMDRGAFHQGSVQWRRDLPRWIDEVLVARGKPVAKR